MQTLRRGAVALFLLVTAGCSAHGGSPADASADLSMESDLGVDVGGDLGGDVGDVPASPWQIEFRDATTQFWDIWGSGPNDIYAVGHNGDAAAIYHSAGDGKWLAQTTGVPGGLYAVWGSGPNDIYAAGSGYTLLHSTGDGTWTAQTVPGLFPLDIWGSSASDVYVTGGGAENVLHSTGDGIWSALNIGSAPSEFATIWGTSATNVYFAGGNGPGGATPNPYIVHGPNAPTAETILPLPDMYRRDIFQLWGSGPDDIYAVGNSNQILHSVGDGIWTLQTSPQGAALGGVFEDIWGSGPNDIYVVGDGTGVVHSTGDGVWTIDPDLHNSPLGVWGSGPNDIYVVGDNIAHKKL